MRGAEEMVVKYKHNKMDKIHVLKKLTSEVQHVKKVQHEYAKEGMMQEGREEW